LLLDRLTTSIDPTTPTDDVVDALSTACCRPSLPERRVTVAVALPAAPSPRCRPVRRRASR
jgi:hypothetical protein